MNSNRSFTHLVLISMLTATAAWAGPKDVSSSAQKREIARPKPAKPPQPVVVAQKPKQDPVRTKQENEVQKKPAMTKVDDRKEVQAIRKPREAEPTKTAPMQKEPATVAARPKTETARQAQPVKTKQVQQKK